jgi:hypothetical protein
LVAAVFHEEAAEEGEVGRVDKRRMSWNPLDDTSQRGCVGVPERARCEGGVACSAPRRDEREGRGSLAVGPWR